MTISDMWYVGIFPIGAKVRSNLDVLGPSDPYFGCAMHDCVVQIESMWYYGICTLEEMQRFRHVFSLYCKKKFGIYV